MTSLLQIAVRKLYDQEEKKKRVRNRHTTRPIVSSINLVCCPVTMTTTIPLVLTMCLLPSDPDLNLSKPGGSASLWPPDEFHLCAFLWTPHPRTRPHHAAVPC